MTTLLCDSLYTFLDHEIRFISPTRIHIAGIYPYLLKCGHPVGTFTVSLIKNSVTLFSNSFSESDISSAAYSHTFYPVIPVNPIQIEPGLYTIRLSSSGYSYSNIDFISWIQQFENVQNEMEYVHTGSSQNPLALRIKTYKSGIV